MLLSTEIELTTVNNISGSLETEFSRKRNFGTMDGENMNQITDATYFLKLRGGGSVIFALKI